MYLVHVQRAMMSAVALAASVLQTIQQAGENLEVLESLKMGVLDFFSFGTHDEF